MNHRIRLTIILLTLAIGAFAWDFNQQQEKFSPEKFDQALHDFIVSETHMTQQEEAKFFPIYREMQQKQRAILDRQRNTERQRPQDDEACRRAIQERDQKDIEVKRIQQEYHKRFMEVLPPTRVWEILKAEERFHRRAMRDWGQGQHRPQGQHAQKGQRPGMGGQPNGHQR